MYFTPQMAVFPLKKDSKIASVLFLCDHVLGMSICALTQQQYKV